MMWPYLIVSSPFTLILGLVSRSQTALGRAILVPYLPTLHDIHEQPKPSTEKVFLPRPWDSCTHLEAIGAHVRYTNYGARH